jgi:uncharacterized membrane protein
VFGLSLGSFGGETAFSGEYDLRNRTAGALFAGRHTRARKTITRSGPPCGAVNTNAFGSLGYVALRADR